MLAAGVLAGWLVLGSSGLRSRWVFERYFVDINRYLRRGGGLAYYYLDPPVLTYRTGKFLKIALGVHLLPNWEDYLPIELCLGRVRRAGGAGWCFTINHWTEDDKDRIEAAQGLGCRARAATSALQGETLLGCGC